MTRAPATPIIRHVEDWRALITLHAYRGLVGFGLLALLILGHAGQLFELALPALFRLSCNLYGLLWALTMGAALGRRPSMRLQVLLACAIDVIFYTVLTLASTGVAGGLGMLLIAPLSAAGMLLPGRMAALLAACAAIGLLGQEILRPLLLTGAHSEFLQGGILGALFFLTVTVSHWLAGRAREGEQLAAQRASEVRDLAELNQRIIRHMQIGAIVVDADRRLRLINDAALGLLDLPEPIADDAALPALAPALADALEQWLQAPHASGQVIHTGGRSLLPLFSRLGTDAHAPVLIFLEDAVRQSEQAQQLKLVSLGRLTSGIAHEIRNPLGAISHAGQLLAESTTLGPEETHLLDIVHRHTRRIDAIVSNVLGLSRRSRLTRQTLTLADWLHDAVADYRQYNDPAPVFEIGAIDPELRVEFDPGHLRQVLNNLWDNAGRYARREGATLRIRLTLKASRSGLSCLDVTDNGPGLDQGIVNQVMDPFFTTTREGTGLGLYIARELCEANRARLMPVAQSPGACFRIIFAHAWPSAGHPTPPSLQQSE